MIGLSEYIFLKHVIFRIDSRPIFFFSVVNNQLFEDCHNLSSGLSVII